MTYTTLQVYSPGINVMVLVDDDDIIQVGTAEAKIYVGKPLADLVYAAQKFGLTFVEDLTP